MNHKKHKGNGGVLLSIIVVIHDMYREAPRTLFSLSEKFQHGVVGDDYEVIVVDNGSPEPFTDEILNTFEDNVRYFYIENASPSPASAINFGVKKANAPYVGIMIDGARLASPGVVQLALSALYSFDRAFVYTIAFHIGTEAQNKSVMKGYSPDVEDKLLADINWRQNGYNLFEVSAPAGSSPYGWLGPINESNLLFLSKEMFYELGGYDERFDLPGGGIVNLDFFNRCCELEDSTHINLFGEATFHQVHGGIMTNRPFPEAAKELGVYAKQYKKIRGVEFQHVRQEAILFGSPKPEIARVLRDSCKKISNVN